MSLGRSRNQVPHVEDYVLTPDGTPYLYFRFPVEFVVGMAIVFMLAGVALLGSLIAMGGPPIAWLIAGGVTCGAAGWVYWFASAEYELLVAHAELTWRSLRRRGRCPITNLVKIRPSANGLSAALTLDSGRSLRVPVTSDFLPFARGVAEAYPDVDVWTIGYGGIKLTGHLFFRGRQ